MDLPLINTRSDERPDTGAHFWHNGWLPEFHVAHPKERYTAFVMSGVVVHLWDEGPVGMAWAECAWEDAAATAACLADQFRPWAASASAITQERSLASRIDRLQERFFTGYHERRIREEEVRGILPDEVIDAHKAAATERRSPDAPLVPSYRVDYRGPLQGEIRRLEACLAEGRHRADAALPDMSALPPEPGAWWLGWEARSQSDRTNWGDVFARRVPEAWTRVSRSRDQLFRWCLATGMARMELHRITGASRATIDRIMSPK
ncbi:hypothetical protein ACH427_03115 [Streptomyces sp. NPDC020379]|uniref:hypothetical protein n=1 Tax=Streptomyces sp. NPDC020379 TaxID=3365071 RepID=UPI0037ACB481